MIINQYLFFIMALILSIVENFCALSALIASLVSSTLSFEFP